MDINWKKLVNDVKLVVREGDPILIDAPKHSMAAKFNGKEGIINSFSDQWVNATIEGIGRRFRADEFKIL